MRKWPTSFTLTHEHVALLRRMYVGWQDCEFGAPEIDPKRPYGNSSVAYDVAEILGLPREADGDLDDAVRERCETLHFETGVALQIVLATGAFEIGEYGRTDFCDTRSWAKRTPTREGSV